jgi:hypothetical protein
MSFKDKVKTSADLLARTSMETGARTQAKLESRQAKRRGDSLLHDLGAAVYIEHRLGGRPEGTRALMAVLDDHAAEHGLDTSPDVANWGAASAGPGQPAPTSAEEPPR